MTYSEKITPEGITQISCQLPLITSDEVSEQNAHNQLHSLGFDGVAKHYTIIDGDIRNQIAHELDVILFSGLSSIFLSINEIISWAKSNSIAVTGSGRLPSSVIAYVLGLTEIDPLKYNLLFDSFLNKNQSNIPTFCFTICENRISDFIDHICQYYPSMHYGKKTTIPSNFNLEIFGSTELTETQQILTRIQEDGFDTRIPLDDNATLTSLCNEYHEEISFLESFTPSTIQVIQEKDFEYFSTLKTIREFHKLYNYVFLNKERNFLNKGFSWESFVLEKTGGFILYAEQIISIIHFVAGYSYAKAVILWNELGKKRKALAVERTKFISSSMKNGYTQEEADWIFSLLQSTVDFGHLKSHIIGQAMIEYRLKYLQIHFPED